MDLFVSKQPVTLTVIFSYLLSIPDGTNQSVNSQPELQNFLLVNKAIHQSFDSNDTFWLWYIYYVFNCEICLQDSHRLRRTIEKITIEQHPFSPCSSCFWKNEYAVQLANKRLRRQWSVKFSSRVLIHRNIPIIKNIPHRAEHARIHTSDNPENMLAIRDGENNGIGNNGGCSTVPFPRKSSIGISIIFI